jgi:aldehyde dehydrogenase (NAD+)
VETSSAIDKKISCEMGGKNPIIIMDDANLALAVEGSLWGAFGTTGQRCTAASRLIVHEKIYEKFLSSFVERARRLRLGNGLKPSTDVGPLVNESQMKKVLDYIEIGKKEGAKVVTGGRRCVKGECKKGYFIEPTVFTEVSPRMRIAKEEIFGPVVVVIKVKNLFEAIEVANSTQYGLSSSIYTRDVTNSAIAERELDCGIVYINAPTIGAEIQLPFGGTRKSGMGHSEAGGRGGSLDMFTKWKVIYRDFSGKLQKAQIKG